MSEIELMFRQARDELQQHIDAHVAAGGACDFCCRRVPLTHMFVSLVGHVLTTLSAIDTETLEAASVSSVQDPLWAACDDCAPVVRAGDIPALITHVLKFVPEEVTRGLEAVVRSDLRELYEKLYERGMHELATNQPEHEGSTP